jgi:hypothetical protein
MSRIDLGKVVGGVSYNESWVQRLVHQHPEILPISQIEPSFDKLHSVCRELPLKFGSFRTGALDNLLITARGSLVIVETKLWRNPEARRAVVAQAMEYAAAIFKMNYEELEAAIKSARQRAGETVASLYELATEGESIHEPDFIDAVARNLKLGRALVLVVGDGIREDILPLADLLQSHAGHRFAFALVQLAIYERPDGTMVVAPSLIARTTLIERGVVSIADFPPGKPQITISSVRPATTPAGSTARNTISIGEEEFYDSLDQREPGVANLLREFLQQISRLEVYPDWKRSLNLRYSMPGAQPINLGSILKEGYLETAPSTWFGRTDAGRRYNETLASLIKGRVSETANLQESSLRTGNAKMPRLSDLLPGHRDAWKNAMESYIAEVMRSLPSTTTDSNVG